MISYIRVLTVIIIIIIIIIILTTMIYDIRSDLMPSVTVNFYELLLSFDARRGRWKVIFNLDFSTII